MAFHRQIPGGPFVSETGTAQRQIPGGPFVSETVSVGGGTSAVGNDLAGAYAILNLAGADLAGVYAVLSAVGADLAGSYAVLQIVGHDLDGAYAIADGGAVVARPATDLVTTGWTRTPAGGSLVSAIGETSRDDDTYITSPPITATPQPIEGALDRTLPAGAWDVALVVSADTAGVTARVKLLDANGVVVGERTQAVGTTHGLQIVTVTTSATASRFSVEFTR